MAPSIPRRFHEIHLQHAKCLGVLAPAWWWGWWEQQQKHPKDVVSNISRMRMWILDILNLCEIMVFLQIFGCSQDRNLTTINTPQATNRSILGSGSKADFHVPDTKEMVYTVPMVPGPHRSTSCQASWMMIQPPALTWAKIDMWAM